MPGREKLNACIRKGISDMARDTGSTGRGHPLKGLASCILPFSLDNPAHGGIVEPDMRCNFHLGITMLQMSLGDCHVPFRWTNS